MNIVLTPTWLNRLSLLLGIIDTLFLSSNIVLLCFIAGVFIPSSVIASFTIALPWLIFLMSFSVLGIYFLNQDDYQRELSSIPWQTKSLIVFSGIACIVSVILGVYFSVSSTTVLTSFVILPVLLPLLILSICLGISAGFGVYRAKKLKEQGYKEAVICSELALNKVDDTFMPMDARGVSALQNNTEAVLQYVKHEINDSVTSVQIEDRPTQYRVSYTFN